jgi:hypothetical protein
VPIVIKRRPKDPSSTPRYAVTACAAPRQRRQRSDDIARHLAPKIEEIRKAGFHGNAEIAKCLNEEGLSAPSGRQYARETVRRIQQNIRRLGLGDGPQTRSAALRARHAKERSREYKKLEELLERRKREHPDWD